MAETVQGSSAPAPEPRLLQERLRGITGAIRQSADDLFAERYTGDRVENARNLRAIKARHAVLHKESRQVRSILGKIRRGPPPAASGEAHWWQPWKKSADTAISAIDEGTT